MLISPRYHKELRWAISEIQRKTKTLILTPGEGRYSDFNNPTDMSKTEDSKSVVKIVGTRDAAKQAREDLGVRMHNVFSITVVDLITAGRARFVIYSELNESWRSP
jgi:hypothetical protein